MRSDCRVSARLRLWLMPVALLVGGTAAAERPLDFNRDVRPILSDKCFQCHGPDAATREADLRLDDEADAVRDRDGQAVLNRAHPEDSRLLARITSAGDDRMPPPAVDKALSPGEVEILSRWIREGATYARHWAYVPPFRLEPPPVRDSAWPVGAIDRFVLARLEAEGLAPASEADRITLIRRLRFDLTGLPPSPAEVDAFVADSTPDAWERLVDRLLASDECGERLATFWLDLVRFADTVGYHGDQDHNISPFRDYVIEAFIENRPFDQFTRDQLAGDLLPETGDDQQIASGYNRLLQTSHEGGVQPKEYLSIYAADRVRNFSAVWLGGTLGCAQCHDHKFDPYTQKDFYSLIAFFADVDEAQHFKNGGDRIPTSRPPERKLLTKRERARLQAVREERDRAAAEIAALDARSEGSPSSHREELQTRHDRLEAEAKSIEDSARLTMVTASIEPRVIRLLPRGNWLDDSGPEMQPAIPAFLGELEITDRRPTRLDLANWLFDSEQGAGLLTARVFANRFWAIGFGEGLSRSLEDFGGQGEPPSHPELLDFLATEFAADWNVRRLLKQIVMSRTYRQASVATADLRQRDPDNRLLARQNASRVPAEVVRDTALEVSGLLVHEIGGASVRPYQPAGYYKFLNFPTREYEAHHDRRQWRRGLYVHWQRQYLHPMLKAFDAPSREECTAQRPRNNTPLTALVLLNDPTMLEAARVLATRILKDGGDSDASRIDFAWKLALSRAPDATERQVLTETLERHRAQFLKDPAHAGELLKVGDAPPPDGVDPVELAAWTMVARTILNLGETYLRP